MMKCKISVLNYEYLTSYGLLTNIEDTRSLTHPPLLAISNAELLIE